jgi:hypothetical protein
VTSSYLVNTKSTVNIYRTKRARSSSIEICSEGQLYKGGLAPACGTRQCRLFGSFEMRVFAGEVERRDPVLTRGEREAS